MGYHQLGFFGGKGVKQQMAGKGLVTLGGESWKDALA